MARHATIHSDDARVMSRGRVLDFDGEPSLDEMLDDPVIQAVMAQDGVERQEIVDLVASIQSAFCR
ncbi:MAG TPA: hypothetical protein VMQ11_10570 [Alphaproteobacteria bacterium]|nr:hypothetical protein [Alphaproteobacteria bacterium]